MNKEHFNELIGKYLENFSNINDVNEEYYKWVAVKHFKDNWDIDAENFADMFKEAISETSNLINNHIVQPGNGIIKLAERPELTDVVKNLFRDLFYSDDSGDIDKRQDRIETFSGSVNALLDEYEPGKWKYRQDLRCVLVYLNLFAPDKNYFFKATQAKEFMYCVEYGDDFGSGLNFRLSKYYRMCDWLVEQIKSMPELIKTHKDRMTEDMFEEDDYHILAFDIIYCGVTYHLFRDIVYTPPKINAKKKEEKAILEEAKIELTRLSDEFESLVSERASYDDFSAVGMKIEQKLLGKGTVSAHQGRYITVKFETNEKKFLLPNAFVSGFLKTDDESIAKLLSDMSILDDKIDTVRDKINDLQKLVKKKE